MTHVYITLVMACRVSKMVGLASKPTRVLSQKLLPLREPRFKHRRAFVRRVHCVRSRAPLVLHAQNVCRAQLAPQHGRARGPQQILLKLFGLARRQRQTLTQKKCDSGHILPNTYRSQKITARQASHTHSPSWLMRMGHQNSLSSPHRPEIGLALVHQRRC